MNRRALSIRAPQKTRGNVAVLRRYLRGEVALGEALSLDRDACDALRKQAHALYEACRWQQCIDVILGLAAVGDVDPFDPLLLAGAYAELGDHHSASLCTQAAETMLAELVVLLDRAETT
jgi:hypothetical protein